MREPCSKCGAKRTQFEGQTSWECGSYSTYIPGLNPCWAIMESEHCRCRQELEKTRSELDWCVTQRGTYEKACNMLGDEYFELLKRFCKMQNGIKKILPDFNCRMFTPYYKLLKELVEEV